MDHLAGFNPPQKEAILHDEGPLLILAGAGSGKTRVITYRIAHLITERGVRPESILAVTFTNKAAEEMRQRVLQRLPEGRSGNPRLSTFHAFCTRLLRAHASRLGYTHDFTIYDTDDQLKVMKSCLKELALAESVLPPRKAVSVISLAKNSLRTLEGNNAFVGHQDADIYNRLLASYNSKLRAANAMDFDDLLLNALLLLQDHEEVRSRYREQIQHLLIDEYQDTNRLQYLLVRQLAHPPYNVCAVGDEDQSIYQFRGAQIGNILSFENDFPNVRVMKLEQNYRSTKRILEAASAVVKNNRERKDKTLWTRNDAGDLIRCLETDSGSDEAEAVCQTILALKREGLDESFAILYRTNFQSRYFEEALKKDAIPYSLVGSVSFYARAEIRDLVAYLRLLRNPTDEMALDRIINTPPRGIGEATQERLKTRAAANGLSLWGAVEAFARDNVLGGRANRALAEFVHLVQQLRDDMPGFTLARFLNQVAERSGYLGMLREEDSPEAISRLGNIEELVTAAEEWESEGLGVSEFLDRTSLASDTDNYDPQSHVTLMTLHSAKGLEFDVVFLVGLEEGLFPHGQSLQSPSDIEEERRLCYVGMTRARRRLFLSWARHRRSFNSYSHGENLPSRFLSEIPPSLMEFIKEGYSSRESSWGSPFQMEPPPPREKKAFSAQSYNSVESVDQFLRKRAGREGSSSRRSSRIPDPPADPGGPNDYPPGTRVQHPQFGEGYILQATKEGGEMKLTVHFSNHGRKNLIKRYSNLVKI